MSDAGELPAVTESDSTGRVYQLSPNPARDIYPVYPPWLTEPAPAERLRRLDQLDSLERDLLLAYLDGRVPEFVDEWLAGRKPRLPGAIQNDPVSCTKAKIRLDG